MSGLRLVMVLTEAGSGTGGIAKFNRDFLDALAADARVDRLDVVKRAGDCGRAPSVPAFLWRVMRQALRRERIDAVLCGHINLLPLAWLLARVRGAPLVLVIHGYEAWTPPRRRLARWLAPRIDALIAVSKVSADRFGAWAGSAPNVSILPNGVDLERFKPMPRDVALAARCGLGEGPVLLTLGRMAAHERYMHVDKGFDRVIDLMPRLRQRFPKLQYVIAGDGDDRPRLQAKAGEGVIFTGTIAEADKAALYNLADVFVLPSAGEGFGIVLIEAAACGLAVVGSSRDGSRESLRDGELGRLVDPADDDALFEAITAALSAPRQRPSGIDHFSFDRFRQRVSGWLDTITRPS